MLNGCLGTIAKYDPAAKRLGVSAGDVSPKSIKPQPCFHAQSRRGGLQAGALAPVLEEAQRGHATNGQGGGEDPCWRKRLATSDVKGEACP